MSRTMREMMRSATTLKMVEPTGEEVLRMLNAMASYGWGSSASRRNRQRDVERKVESGATVEAGWMMMQMGMSL